jgi:hypothetical protein
MLARRSLGKGGSIARRPLPDRHGRPTGPRYCVLSLPPNRNRNLSSPYVRSLNPIPVPPCDLKRFALFPNHCHLFNLRALRLLRASLLSTLPQKPQNCQQLLLFATLCRPLPLPVAQNLTNALVAPELGQAGSFTAHRSPARRHAPDRHGRPPGARSVSNFFNSNFHPPPVGPWHPTRCANAACNKFNGASLFNYKD